METDSTKKINLNNTILESLAILKGVKPYPNNIMVVGNSFRFFNSNHVLIPNEHIGLASICWQKALDKFYPVSYNEKGEEERHFTPLPKGEHVADCLKEFSNDILCWYEKDSIDLAQGGPLQLTTRNCSLEALNQQALNKVFVKNQYYASSSLYAMRKQNDYRVETLVQTIAEAQGLYFDELKNNNPDMSKEDFSHIEGAEGFSFFTNLQTLCANQISFQKNATIEIPETQNSNNAQ